MCLLLLTDKSSVKPGPVQTTCPPVLTDHAGPNGQTLDANGTEDFVHEAVRLILDDAVNKANDKRQKVGLLFCCSTETKSD